MGGLDFRTDGGSLGDGGRGFAACGADEVVFFELPRSLIRCALGVGGAAFGFVGWLEGPAPCCVPASLSFACAPPDVDACVAAAALAAAAAFFAAFLL